ncbi:MAG TPA: HlyD family efflux transporter periplasmic adaptor subunit [Symbiobacteriaceae bacterium]|jgi:putative membrane fusion protein
MSQPLAVRRRPPTVRRELKLQRAGDPRLWVAATIALVLAIGIPMATIWGLYGQGDENTLPLNQSTLEVTLATDGFLVRREQVYRAPVAGAVRRLVEEGHAVRVGTPVVDIGAAGGQADNLPTVAPALPATPLPLLRGDAGAAIDDLSVEIYQTARDLNDALGRGSGAEVARLQALLDTLAARQWDLARKAGAAPGPAPRPASPVRSAGGAVQVISDVAGLLTYQTDGLEEALNPDSIGSWKPSWFKRLTAPNPDRTGVGNTQSGAPVFKVADSLSLGLVTVVPRSAAPALADDDRVQLRIDEVPGRTVAARVTRHVVEGDELLLYLTASESPEELATLRRVRATLVFAIHNGKIAPRTAVDVRAGVQGVWVKQGDATHFKPVTVLGGNETRVALETDLPPGTRILKVAPQRKQ